ncbi:MAG: tRNA (adenosine(37)-N6)-threonylcarbamoyltransferase complex ATPase subunit type 1 TsaE [Deltaproteobacteria bacterium]|nr:tRNA (adenosine(37)-N6)-threonylcarbamoyltransferase complex ATPase subunit type 1 TsaE [Deltaproteobacteria bacterium]
MRHSVITRSSEATRALGAAVTRSLAPGAVVALNGPLGSGKTCFVQGVAAGLGVPAAVLVNSPTYVLLNIYPGRIPLYHFDWYRLDDAAALTGLDLEEYFDGAGITIVEWAEKFPDALPPRTHAITFTIGRGNTRRILLPPALQAVIE